LFPRKSVDLQLDFPITEFEYEEFSFEFFPDEVLSPFIVYDVKKILNIERTYPLQLPTRS